MEYAVLDPNRLIILVTGDGDDPEGSRSLLARHFYDVPDYMHAFLAWLGTPHGRLATDDAAITIEASPNPGRIWVGGAVTNNDLDTFLTVVSDPRKKRLGLLSITGGVDEFDIFVKSVIGADSEWDINFQTTIKYLVAWYNHYANRQGQPLIPIRHSYLESDGSETQLLYELLPMQYIEMVVINFDLLYPTQSEQQFIGRLEVSMIKPFYPESVVMYETYRGYYLQIVQKCIDMLVPDQTRLKKEFRNDVEVFSSNLVRQFPHFHVDKAELLKMLYAGLVERGTFPWATRDNDLALMQELGPSYNIQLLTSIAGGDFGLTLQLIATGLYYLYFLIMKMFPHYAALKFDLISYLRRL